MEQDVVDTNLTIQALRRNTRRMISTLLNPIKIIPNENGLPRDWAGLAELCQISGEKMPSLQQSSDPTNSVLDLWHENNQTESTIHNLIKFLEELDRFDIVDDITPLIEEDINYFKQNPNGFKCKYSYMDADKYILTIDDVSRVSQGLEPQTYDAFVLFDSVDIEFATELIETLEKQYNLKLCVKDRDLVGGGFDHDSVIRLISERCQRLIVIVSPAFFNSAANKFFCSLAQSIGIEQGQRKIVPCIYKSCGKLPPELSCYFVLDYERQKVWNNFWQKLYSSIKVSEERPAMKKNDDLLRSFSQYNHIPQRSPSISAVDQQSPSSDSLGILTQVKSNSMSDLDSTDSHKILVDENMIESNSAQSLVAYSESVQTRNSVSLYTQFKKKIISLKGTKNNAKSDIPELTDIKIEKKKSKIFGKSKKKVALKN
ncbi:hypothetical protein NQ315_013813 [Exocentrus adspersus]|uniref:Myeloid differentiation primary response protein MyD88 n=1 Tax=Exocentrus adspersus TaxID=1586481 RepID=A0AAV8VBN3_9CUCU|nr:hypothetical protein NQ315_013813 [Exocentrus adspersus]